MKTLSSILLAVVCFTATAVAGNFTVGVDMGLADSNVKGQQSFDANAIGLSVGWMHNTNTGLSLSYSEFGKTNNITDTNLETSGNRHSASIVTADIVKSFGDSNGLHLTTRLGLGHVSATSKFKQKLYDTDGEVLSTSNNRFFNESDNVAHAFVGVSFKVVSLGMHAYHSGDIFIKVPSISVTIPI